MTYLVQAADACLNTLLQLPQTYPQVWSWWRLIMGFVFPTLSISILLVPLRTLFTFPQRRTVWARLSLPNGASVPLEHWENILGRANSCDVVLNYPVVSRQHAALIREKGGGWRVYDLGSKGGVTVNGSSVTSSGALASLGDVVGLGGVETVLLPPPADQAEERAQPKKGRGVWLSLLLLTLFQQLTGLQLLLSSDGAHAKAYPAAFLALSMVMWGYFTAMHLLCRMGCELELVAFWLSTISLAVTASSAPGQLLKQLAAIVLGLALFLVLGVLLRDLERVKKIRWLMAGAAMALISLSLAVGQTKFGAANWISIGGISFQPSEVAKLCYIFAGAATLERLFRRRNLGLFMVLTGFCIACLALMSDFGTAAVFFVTFLVIAYLRSGDWATLALLCGGALFGGLVLISMKPYILRRFATWGHAWQNASTGGFQQTRAMSAAASGGLMGVGPGQGWLHRISAADTDLVFGLVCEEWGLLVALLLVGCIAALSVFAVRVCATGRSSFYLIAACAAGSLLVFQTSLNVLGAMDLLPLTGVTFPFVSNGGSSMLSSWGLLAFFKAADTRSGASFAAPSSEEVHDKAADLLSPDAAGLSEEVRT